MQQNLIAFFRGAFLRHEPRRFAVMQPETADRKYDDHPGALTDSQIAAHLEGRAAYAVPTAQDGLASFLPLDIDAGGTAAARALLDAAQARNLWAFAQVDEQRGRGYVWIPFDELASAERIYALGQQLLTETAQPGFRIENRATAEDTRLPFARHAWTGRRGALLYQNGITTNLDGPDYPAALARFAQAYRENSIGQLPPAAPPPTEDPRRRQDAPSGPGITIQAYNAATDLVSLLEDYWATRAKGQGARLYFCPFHSDEHASLLVNKDGDRCKCLSAGSGCPLSAHQNDAFNVFCIGEGLSTAQALRRLNGLPDEPQAASPILKPPRKPPQAPNKAKSTRPSQRPANDTVRPPQTPEDTSEEASDSAPSGATTDTAALSLSKSARRVLDYITAQAGDYCRGKWHLARVLDLDARTVQRSLRRLEAEGVLERQQRGREGQTDIYRVSALRATPDTPPKYEGSRAPRSPKGEEGGRQLPPTITHKESSITSVLGTVRGGIPSSAATSALDTSSPDEDGAQHGPGGALAYPQGAAYVPPEAASWYAATVGASTPLAYVGAGCADPEPFIAEPLVAEPLVAEQLPAPLPETISQPEPSKPRKRPERKAAPIDPGQLAGRIIAATRKAERLERGSASERRQAAAIRRQVEQLQRRQERAREEQAAHWYDAEACDAWQEAQDARGSPVLAEATPAPPSSLPGMGLVPVDYAAIAHGLAERLRLRLIA